MVELITGRTGAKHVYAKHDALLNRTLLGSGDYVINFGDSLSYTPKDASHIDIQTGYLVMQGRLCEVSSTETVEFAVCSAGTLKRKDIIVAEYTINEMGIENVRFVSINGVESSNDYVTPEIPYSDGSIDDGETHQMPLYAIYVDGFSIRTAEPTVEQLYTLLSIAPLDTAMEYVRTFATRVQEEVGQEIDDMKSRASGTIPVITISNREPTSADGEDGEFWVVY